MEAGFIRVRASTIMIPTLARTRPPPSLVKLRWQQQQPKPKPKMARCMFPSSGSMSHVEKELTAEAEEMGKWLDKCRGQSLVDLLECLEREAIMGDDEGNEPCDYNRRARIFDKSSRVFGPLRQTDAETTTSPEPSA